MPTPLERLADALDRGDLADAAADELAAHAAESLADATAGDVLGQVSAAFARPVITSSFGVDSTLLLAEAAEHAPTLPVAFLDTGFHFEETVRHRRDIARLVPNPIVDVAPPMTTRRQAAVYGPRLYDRAPDTCCGIRKVAPLRALLQGHDAWITGVRREQTEARRGTPVVSIARMNEHRLARIAPLAGWTGADVAERHASHGLPVHPLAEAGYTSVGCEPCTAPPADGDRDGRWAGNQKTECGLHMGRLGGTASS